MEAIRQGQVGGGESHLLNLVQNIDKEKFEPIVLSFTDGAMIDSLNKMKIKTHVIPSQKAFNISVWKKVKKLLQEEEIDVVHVHGTRAASNVYHAAKQLNLPLIYTIHGWSFHDDQSWFEKNMRIIFEQYITKQTDCNISVSTSNQQTGKKYISGFKSVVINNGIDLKRFDPDKRFKNVRAELKIAEDKCVIGFIGRITAQKDPLTLLPAFAKVAEQNKDAVLLMVGEGDLKEQTIELAGTLKLEDKVVFENFREDIPDVLNAIDIFCLPSLWEGLPFSLLEAMAMRKAVIATGVDGSVEIIENNKSGLLIPVNNENALAQAILKLINNISLRNELASAARETITYKFDACEMTKEIEKVYLNGLNKKQFF